jgi:WD40 repeat protein
MDQEFRIPSMAHGTDEPANSIQASLKTVLDSISSLTRETADLERTRDLAIIHLQQLENDAQQLRMIHKNLKARLRLDAPLRSPFPESPIPIPAEGQLPPGKVDWFVISRDPFFRKPHIRLRYSLTVESILCAIRFNNDGSFFTFSDGKSVFFVTTRDGSVAGSMPWGSQNADSIPRSICFSPDSKYLAISGGASSLLVINVPQRSVQTQLNVPNHVVSTIVFFQDGKAMITGGFDGKLCIWSVPEFQLTRIIQHGIEGQVQKKDMIVSIAFGRDDEFLGVGFMSGAVGMYEPTFSQPMSSFQAHSEILLNLVISRQDIITTASHDKTVQLWSVRGVASCKHVLRGHEDYVLAVAFSPNDPVVFTGSKDETIKCWSQKTGENLFTIKGHTNTLFQIDHHPVERTIVSCGGDGLVCIWDYELP